MCRSFAKWIVTSLFLVLMAAQVSWGESKIEAAKVKVKESAPTNPPTESAIKITLAPSREQAVAGSNFGITGLVENVSGKPVYFTCSSFSMTAPPELDPGGPNNWPAFFPDIQVPSIDSEKDPQAYWERYRKTVVVLKPGSKIPAFWSGKFRDEDKDHVRDPLRRFFRGLSFSPGKYTLTAVGGYWDDPAGPTDHADQARTQTAEMQELISAPQATILFGAALGGLFAFLLVWKVDPSRYSGWERGAWMGVVSSILLSIIVTILLARLSDTQFFIRVTVNDLWGAMAVGFIGSALGPTILDKFIKLFQGSVTKQEKEGNKQIPPTTGSDAGARTTVSGTVG
jgi:hypothetical protein